MSDVTIIGAGPGGSTAAILLARAGWDVTLIEQSRFPRDKVCGECLSALGFDVVKGLGLADVVRSAGAVRLDDAVIHDSSGQSLTIRLPSSMWGISRRLLDELLLDAARGAGARVRQPARCEGIAPEQAAGAAQRSPGFFAREYPRLRCAAPAACRVTLRDLVSNDVETFDATHVVLADGKAAFAHDTPPVSGAFGIKAHFVDVDGPRDAIELFGVRGSYGGLAAIEGDRWNAAFSVPTARLRAHRGDVDALFCELVSENPVLARRIAGAKRVGEWLASPLPRFAVRRRWPANVIPVGNAAAAVEPIGGEGMGLAMRSAELAANALIARTPESLPAEFRALWRTRRPACRAAALAASSPGLIRMITTIGLPRPAQRLAMRLIGKQGTLSAA